jgi:hypothetical protein
MFIGTLTVGFILFGWLNKYTQRVTIPRIIKINEGVMVAFSSD